MKWEKIGLIFKPQRNWWMKTHVQNPFCEKKHNNIYKIYFAGRDKNNQARGGWVDIDFDNKYKIVGFCNNPIIDLGKIGCFDDCGVMPSCIVDYNNKKYLYYTGWSRTVVTPFTFYIGLMISDDNGRTFRRYSEAPVLGRNFYDPYLTASPWVILENKIWRMWYTSCTTWEKKNSRLKHYYHIRYCESNDGINWKTDGTVCIDYIDDEYAIARPIVYKENDLYKMWYCYRGGERTYRAGYAESKDGIKWTRKDNEVGLDVSEDGWDSYMICYPFVFNHKGTKYMLYNGGTNYGDNGCGLAKMIKE